jgi:single-stranded-DNA-specific exonuclease
MDEVVQIPSNLLSRFKTAATEVEKASEVRVISHNDADGISSAAIVCATLLRKNKRFQCTMLKGFEESVVRNTAQGCDLLIISDMGSSSLDVLDSLPIKVIVLDHHKPERDSNKVIHVNPHLFGIDGATSACAASVAMMLSVTISEKNWDLLPIAFGGIIGDRQTIRGLLGLNRYLGQLGQEKRIMEVRQGSLIPSGPLKESLFNSTDPFITGVSGDADGVSRLLTEAGILDSMSLESLDGAQEMKLSSLITLRLLAQGATLDNLEEGSSEKYYFSDRKLYGHQLSSLMNACGRSDLTGMGAALVLGDSKSWEKAEKLRHDYHKTVLEAVLAVQFKGLRQLDNLQYFFSPVPDVSSDICGIIMQWTGDRDKPTIALSQKNGEVKISSRANKKMIENGVDLSYALRTAAGAVGGVGGGHNVASGGKIPAGKEDEFIAAVDKIIGEQRAKGRKAS